MEECKDLKNRITELESQLADKHQKYIEAYDDAKTERELRAETQAELKEAKEVIKFYADENNWTSIRDINSPSGYFYSCTDDTDEEPFNKKDKDDERVIGGKRARAFLKGSEG